MKTVFTEWKIAAKDGWKMSVLLENFKFFIGSHSTPQHKEMFIIKDHFLWVVFSFVAGNSSLHLLLPQHEDYSERPAEKDHRFPPSPHPNALLIPIPAGSYWTKAQTACQPLGTARSPLAEPLMPSGPVAAAAHSGAGGDPGRHRAPGTGPRSCGRLQPPAGTWRSPDGGQFEYRC